MVTEITNGFAVDGGIGGIIQNDPIINPDDPNNLHVITTIENPDGVSITSIDINSTVPEEPELPDPTGTSVVDQDNDVPTLITIRSKLEDLEILAEQRNEALGNILNGVIDMRGVIRIGDDDNYTERNATLADIYYAITGETNNTAYEFNATEEQERYNEDINEDSLTDMLEGLNTPISVTAPTINPDTELYLDWDFGDGLESFDLFNISSKFHGSLPTLTQVLGAIKTVIILLILFLYFKAMKSLAERIISTMIQAQESNTVTNYSVLGNSVGAVAVKASKVALWLAFGGAIFATMITAISESEISATLTSFGSIGAALSGILTAESQGFMKDAYGYFTLVFPVATALTAWTSYNTIRFLLWTELFVMNRLMRVAS